MTLSERSIEWLRDLSAGLGERADLDPIDAARRLGLAAAAVPAWSEPFGVLVGRLVDLDAGAADDVRRCFVDATSLEPCPQIVDVEFPSMALSRAEWVRGNLHITLAPNREDPNVFTSFRLVGAEPRNWDVHGMDGVAVELTISGVNVRVPMVAGDVELIRGSY